MSTEWYWGLRSPVQWGKKESYQEAITWSEEVYTKAYFDTYGGAAIHASNGDGWFGLTINPWILFWDVAMIENLFYIWPKTDENPWIDDDKRFDWCNYTGWWYKMGILYIDFTVMTRECSIGVYDTLVDSGDWRCFSSTYTVNKATYMKLKPYNFAENGMYEWGPKNTCHEHPHFDRWDGVERGFLDALKGTKESVDDAEFDDVYDNDWEDGCEDPDHCTPHDDDRTREERFED